MTENRDHLGLLEIVLNEGNRHKKEIAKLLGFCGCSNCVKGILVFDDRWVQNKFNVETVMGNSPASYMNIYYNCIEVH